jgi:molybdenum cofactor biosynthesis enzyme MoaA
MSTQELCCGEPRLPEQDVRAKVAGLAERVGDGEKVGRATKSEPPCPFGCVGCGQHLTRPCCVLLEITQRCNLRCRICYADAGFEQKTDPTLAAIADCYDALKRQAGICHIQLSGGEPTLRNDLEEIIRLGRNRGFEYFQLNTNGIRLAAKPQLAKRLKAAGLTTVFLQFDGVDDTVNQILRGAELLEIKEQAIAACAEAALPVVLTPTVVRGVNDGQLADIVRFAIKRSPVVRGVHFQPATFAGRWQLDGSVSLAELSESCCEDRHISIPQLLAELERQSSGMIHARDFSGGTVEHEQCSFNANYYIGEDGQLERLLGGGQNSCCEQAQPAAKSCCEQAQPAPTVANSCCEQAQPAPTFASSCCEQAQPSVTGPSAGSASDGVARAQDIQRRRWGTNLEQQFEERPAPGTLDEAYWQATMRSFSITGMAFMDAQTLNLERLRRCYIFIMDQQANLVPFCAYNLTDAEGRALYRECGWQNDTQETPPAPPRPEQSRPG